MVENHPGRTEKSLEGLISDQHIYATSYPAPLPLSIPHWQRINTRFLRKRSLQLLNAFLRGSGLTYVGSPWLPGFYQLNQNQAQEVVRLRKGQKDPLVMVTSEPMTAPGWFSFRGDPFMVLSLRPHWSSMADYAQDLRKKYRARLKKSQQFSRDIAICPLDLDRPEVRAQCAELLEQTLVDKVVALPGNTEALLLKYAHCFGGRFKPWGFYQGSSLEAFITLVEDGAVLRAMHFGKSRNSDPALYSTAMFHAIAQGIAGKFNQVHLGRTATEIKSTYGAMATDNYFSFYTQRWWWRLLLKRAERTYRPGSYVLRDALKE